MHYSNGREARVGDLVRGKGYNLKYEFTGIVTHITPDSGTCNCQVATVTKNSHLIKKGYINSIDGSVGYESTPTEVRADIEYGQCDGFVALDPKTGEVLS